jgi:hypothetical protein
MNKKRKRLPEQDRDNTVAGVEHAPNAPLRSPMEQFETLARQVVGVTREQLNEEQERYDAAKGSPRGPRPRSS